MKIILPLRKHIAHHLLPGLLLLMLAPVLTAATTCTIIPGTYTSLPSKSHHGDTIVVEKNQNNKKHRIGLYPDAEQEALFFSADGKKGHLYQLYVFNMEGDLIYQVHIKNKQTSVIQKIEKGDYLFEVLSNDERIENGQIHVR